MSAPTRSGPSSTASAVLVRLPGRGSYVTPAAVRAALATLGPKASHRQVRAVLGGGSLRDIATVVRQVRADGLAAQHAALSADADLAPKLFEVLERLIVEVALLRAMVRAEPAPTPSAPDTAWLKALQQLDTRWQRQWA